ncbi:hypothetical protein CHH58_16100 [Terribacillus saccharophilus]|uniref:hypothetical protein n=1 Tax=Terribacillus saccharophilus TaxID=361277 RepID=UPI000BA76E67|nr:hypothetical protein [Terribacillus saccharophilus]PAF35576.1 hypothetical protein CHH58_16100 [Terribacillus saccharophilus]
MEVGKEKLKKLSRILISALIIVLGIGLFNVDSADAATYQPGDIFITDATSYDGITGHVAIYLGGGGLMHTSGWKTEPYPETISVDKFKSRYKNRIKVIRPPNAKVGQKAVDAAMNYFYGRNIPYSVVPTGGLTNISKTYCSELVWYSYYKAGLEFKQANVTSQGKLTWYRPTVWMPYDFQSEQVLKHVGFTWVDKKF